MGVKRTTKTAHAVDTCTAENGAPSNDVFVVGLHKTVDGNSSAKTELNIGFEEVGDKNVLEKGVAHIVCAE